MNSNFKTPILFLIYKRPDLTKRVFESIRKIRPMKLYVSADGPKWNNNDEIEACNETRKIINEIDWDCEVKTKFNKYNTGCRLAVSGAISWFFENENEGIIIEDDCLPNISFFHFCSELLEKYRNDNTIGHIGGTNFQKGIVRGNGSYYFSNYSHVWGWATWKRAWNLYDLNLNNLNMFIEKEMINDIAYCVSEKNYWLDKFDSTNSGKINTWDYQWLFSLWFHKLKSITPNVNLVSNIGFDERGTHEKKSNNKFSNIETKELDFILYPKNKNIDKQADQYTYYNVYKRFILSNIYLFMKHKTFINNPYLSKRKYFVVTESNIQLQKQNIEYSDLYFNKTEKSLESDRENLIIPERFELEGIEGC